MNNGDQLKKANETHLHHTALMLACQDLESATYAARQAREKLRRATRNRLQAKERHADAVTRWKEEVPGTAISESVWSRVDLLRWALENAERDEHDALEDYRDALKRLEVLGATVGEADSHEVPAYVRHRARKAIALADAFGNKVAMDATLHEGLDRPVLPELEPEVEVTEFRVIDPLEPVEARPAPETRAVLVPVDDYEADGSSKAGDVRLERNEEGVLVPVEKSWQTEEEPFVSGPWCPECIVGKHGNCDGNAWDDEHDRPASCRCDHEDVLS